MKGPLVVLTLGTLVITGLVQGGEGKKDKAALQGTWSATVKDKKFVLELKGDKFTATIDENEVYKGTFKIDPSQSPKHIDFTIKEGDKWVNQTSLGLYELKGDKLKWCANEPGKDQRPTEFADKMGDERLLLVVLERQKKKKKD
jgi:uncharacterized protein (TIGR03067 family)